MGRTNRLKIMLCGIAVIIATIIIWWVVNGTDVHTEGNGSLEMTPTQIEKIRSIGEWEFLAISDEELIDTIRHGFFGNDELTRIYYGTLRLGIDMVDAGDGFITMDKDTVVVTLPSIKLLDDNFIDEARTRSFIEDGKWSEADREAMTVKAKAAMKRRCLTKENLDKAEKNARTQVKSVIRSMGFEYCRVR